MPVSQLAVLWPIWSGRLDDMPCISSTTNSEQETVNGWRNSEIQVKLQHKAKEPSDQIYSVSSIASVSKTSTFNLFSHLTLRSPTAR